MFLIIYKDFNDVYVPYLRLNLCWGYSNRVVIF